jgi:hypothetical protein
MKRLHPPFGDVPKRRKLSPPSTIGAWHQSNPAEMRVSLFQDSTLATVPVERSNSRTIPWFSS